MISDRNPALRLFALIAPNSSLFSGALVTLAVQAAFVLRWIYRHHRDQQIQRIFIRDMATKHLPQIYSVLERMAAANGIDPGSRPSIRFIDHKEMDE